MSKYIDDVSGHEIDERREDISELGWSICDVITPLTFVIAVVAVVWGWI